MSDTEPAVIIKDLYKSFKLPHEQHSGIKQGIINGFKGVKGYETQKVLKKVSFEIKKGDFFGIVGRNGSGKSTLLKLIAGIYAPDKGLIQVNGSLTPFIELGVGFNPELTGRENVFLNGALLGFSKSEMDKMYDSIVEFAELEQFMDQKLKNYSSGMQVRLAFSIAIRAEGDVLLLDEVLAVGDEAFQRKCYSYFAQLKKEKKTVILVTHSMDSVQQFCNKAILIDQGARMEIGSPLRIAQIYRELNDTNNVTVNGSLESLNLDQKTEKRYADVQATWSKSGNKYSIDFKIKQKQPINDPVVAVGIYRESGEQVYRWASDEKTAFKLDLSVHTDIQIILDDLFPMGTFLVNMYIKKRDRTMDYAIFNEILKFEVKNSTQYEHATFWKIPERTLINGKELGDVHR